LTTLVSILFR
jgi:hypothetical protein